MINPENVQKFKSYGFVLTPVVKSKNPDDDKKPLVNEKTNYKWSNKVGYEWNDQELLDANRLGAWHRDSKIFDVDFDDKEYNAHKFIDCLPATFTVGKKVNGRTIATHLIYKTRDNVKDYKKAQPLVELLGNTQTIIAGVDRVIINDQEPIYYSADDIRAECKLIATFSELYKHSKDLTNRNDFYFKLGGALARHTDVPMHQRIKYVEKLCELTGDHEVKNRVGCIERQQENFENKPDEVFGLKELAESLGANLKFFDLIKREEEEEKVEATGLKFLNGHEFTIKDYPKPTYILYPIVAKQQIRQVFAKAGSGKTLMMMHEACAVASGHGFLHFKNEKQIKTPVLYVEGEMDASSIQKRFDDIEVAYQTENKKLNKEFMFFSILADQKDMYFHSLTKETGRLNVEITAQKIEKITGLKPVIYLDNITALTVMQEKEGAEWVELMQWLSRLRNRGYHVTFLHHPTKEGKTASGSNIKERSIDIDMKLETPDEKTLIEDYEEGHTQMSIEFLKWREHMNTFYSKKRIAIINRSTGLWDIFPMLTKTQRSIYLKLKEGKKAEDIINATQEGMSKANVYRTIKILKAEGVLEDEVSR
jgi:RecA-family ATPase|tara:strand:+ start:240 stop:2018 length:1779 start_codon:yes stop_codon:yes gene_type:complete